MNIIQKFTARTDHEIGTGKVLPTRTINLDLGGKALVSMVSYGGNGVDIAIHHLTRQDVYKLITELTHVLNSMIDNGS